MNSRLVAQKVHCDSARAAGAVGKLIFSSIRTRDREEDWKNRRHFPHYFREQSAYNMGDHERDRDALAHEAHPLAAVQART